MTDDKLDALFKLPLGEFTRARDAAAKAAGPAGAGVRRLPKPNRAAWAVNQVYWHHRRTFDRLRTAAKTLRSAHARRLAGQAADLDRAELVHRAAVRAALATACEVLVAGGEPPTPAVTHAIAETLEAYPWPEPEGRLTRPVRPTGLAALAGLLPGDRAGARHAARIVSLDRARSAQLQHQSPEERAGREDQARRRDVAAARRSLESAETGERRARAALVRAEQAARDAEGRHRRLAAELERSTSRLQAARDRVAREARRTREAAAEKERSQARITTLEAELARRQRV
jgi:hypothetical protein